MDLSFMKPRWVCVAAGGSCCSPGKQGHVFVCPASRWDPGLELKLTKNLPEINFKPWSSIPEQSQEGQGHCAAILGSSQGLWEHPRTLEIPQNTLCLQDLVPELLGPLPLEDSPWSSTAAVPRGSCTAVTNEVAGPVLLPSSGFLTTFFLACTADLCPCCLCHCRHSSGFECSHSL